MRAALVVAFASGQRLDPTYVAGTVKGSVFYAYDPTTRAYWVVADFSPSAAARSAHARLDGGPDDPLVQFQGGPWILSRGQGAAWRLVSDTGGFVCPGLIPADVLALWGTRDPNCT